MKKIKFTSAFFIILASIFYIGCGDDSTGPNDPGSGGGGYHPNLTFTPGQQFKYSTDSISPSGTPIHKRISSTNTIQAQAPYQGETCYPVTGFTYDSVTTAQTPEAYWFRYDQSTGKFYQYGIKQLININQTGSWDLVGDFDAARGSTYPIGDVNYTINVPGIGTANFTGPLTGMIADSTTITTTGNPIHSIPCYKIVLSASVSANVSGADVTTTIKLDYYLGFASPTGLVELKLNPFSFTVGVIPNVAPQPGFDRKLYTHTP